jgi:hypothetical protein
LRLDEPIGASRAVRERHPFPGTADGLVGDAALDIDPFRAKTIGQGLADLGLALGQEAVAAQESHVHAEAGEELGQLTPHIAAADDDHGPGQALEGQRREGTPSEGTPSRPGMGGAAAWAPVAMTIPRGARLSPLTATPSAVKRTGPSM